MLVLRALLISAIALGGIALVISLVRLIAGDTTTSISLTLVASFLIASVWAYLSLKDSDRGGR